MGRTNQPKFNMCMVSAIGDNFKDSFPQKWPQVPYPWTQQFTPFQISLADFEALKKEVEELKKLLQAAKKFDDLTGQPHCEMDDKVRMIKEIAKLVGVELGDVFGTPKPKKKKK